MIYLDKSRIVDFRLNLLNIQEEKLVIPDIKYSNKIIVNSNEFYDICKNFSDIDDYVKIECYVNSVKFQVHGLQQTGCIIYNASKEKQNIHLKNHLIQIDNSHNIEQNYSLKYLQMIANGSVINNSITLQIHEKYPLCIQCDLKDGGFIKYYLAPQIVD